MRRSALDPWPHRKWAHKSANERRKLALGQTTFYLPYLVCVLSWGWGFLFFHSPIKVSQTRRIAKSFCKRIRIDFQFCNQLILIGRHGREYSLREYEGFMIHILQFLGIAGYALPMAETHQMNAWLISMHRIQHDLQRKRERGLTLVLTCCCFCWVCFSYKKCTTIKSSRRLFWRPRGGASFMGAIKTVACLVNRASPLFMDFSMTSRRCFVSAGQGRGEVGRGREGYRVGIELLPCLLPLHLPPNCQQFSFILRNLHMPCSLARLPSPAWQLISRMLATLATTAPE